MSRTQTLRWGALAALLAAAPLAAQEREPSGGPLPATVAQEAVELYNAAGTTRLDGESRLAPGSELSGDVAVVQGPFVVAGTVRGRVLVINGDLQLRPGARITGAVLVVGGTVRGLQPGRVDGDVRMYDQPLSFRREDGRLVAESTPHPSPLTAGHRFSFGRADLTLAVRGAYNRVEGLPVAFGPRIELGGSNPTVLDGRLIYRTQSGISFRPNEFGYDVKAEQYLGGHRAALFGLALRSVIDPIQASGLSNAENSLATFLFHTDYRDEFQRDGWSAYLSLFGRSRPWDFTVEYLNERDSFKPPREPWALQHNDEPWRPEPLVAQGHLQSLVARLHYDSRNDPLQPSAGWLASAWVEQGVGGDLALLQRSPANPLGPLVLLPVDREFTSVHMDLRRYVRIDPRQRVALRLLAAGSADGSALPPQRQQTLGGEGQLPGYPLMRFDCGARSGTVSVGGVDFYPYYGCDRLVLGQIQYSLAFPIVPGLGRRLGLDVDFGDVAELVLFGDAGRVWVEDKASFGREPGLNGLVGDVGVGVTLGTLGLYWAAPLSGGLWKGINFFVRIDARL
ncbi:MAG TPA: BamA/TamA family outer membrane protein [Longimicrobiales bacterium]|nr:BamA/TamA family outer membrane protein [Longimicrobiales bacterium]